MSPKEKALDLIKKFEFSNESPLHRNDKDCALISVEQTIKVLSQIPKYATDDKFEYIKKYWQEVKEELQKL